MRSIISQVVLSRLLPQCQVWASTLGLGNTSRSKNDMFLSVNFVDKIVKKRKLVDVLSESLSALCTGHPFNLYTYYSLLEGQKRFEITLQKLNPSQSLISE